MPKIKKPCCEKIEKEKKSQKRKENCMVCGAPLEYLKKSVRVACNYCGKKELAYIKCPKGHYVCEECHGKGAYEAIKDIAFSTNLKDPIEIAEVMMAHPSVPMLGCENALIAAAALMGALKNKDLVKNRDIVEAMNRTKKQALSGYCGLTGVCGVAVAIGSVFSILLSTTCSKDREMSMSLHVIARVSEAIANDAGPCCCKSFVRTALGTSYNLAKEYLKVELPIHREKISCFYSAKHSGCRKGKCLYYPKVK